MEQNRDYIHTLNLIRERIQSLNTQLDTYKKPVETSILTSGVDSSDKAMIVQCQKKTENMHFVASVNEFSFHWETMTSDQHKKYIEDYVETEYSAESTDARKEILFFLIHEIIHKKSGFKLVRWNGYFIEHIPNVDIQYITTKTEENNKSDKILVTFKKQVEISVADKNVSTKKKHTSFNTMRAKLQREKDTFYLK